MSRSNQCKAGGHCGAVPYIMPAFDTQAFFGFNKWEWNQKLVEHARDARRVFGFIQWSAWINLRCAHVSAKPRIFIFPVHSAASEWKNLVSYNRAASASLLQNPELHAFFAKHARIFRIQMFFNCFQNRTVFSVTPKKGSNFLASTYVPVPVRYSCTTCSTGTSRAPRHSDRVYRY